MLAGTAAADTPTQSFNSPGFAAVWQVLDRPRLSGTGRLSYFGLRIFDAWLWVGPEGLDPTSMATPFVLELKYAHGFSGNTIAKRTSAEIAQLGLGTPQQRLAWAEWLAANIPDVKRGEKLTSVYRPGNGMSLLHNGWPVASTTDASLARAFFSIWLDEHTSEPVLRAELLRNATAP